MVRLECRYCQKPFEEHSRESQNNPNLWKEAPMSNPSPRDIFQKVQTECEKRSFDEFMKYLEGLCLLPWEEPITDTTMQWIKKDHPDWHHWLISKGLLTPKMVKREAWVNVYFKNGRPFLGSNHTTEEAAKGDIGFSDTWGKYIKTILLHSWEEPEGEKT